MEDEFELTYLVKQWPEGFTNPHEFKEILDIYIPASALHAFLRLRKNGEKYEITKKNLVAAHDASHQIENTIPLSLEEFEALSAVQGKRVRKIRHYYKENDSTYEIDVFQDALEGLVLADIEFVSAEEKAKFVAPTWLGKEITQEEFIAGGVLSGKSYEDIAHKLSEFGYEKLN